VKSFADRTNKRNFFVRVLVAPDFLAKTRP